MDWFTVISLVAIATSLTILFHEGVHALTCLALGGKVREFSGLHVWCVNKSAWQSKVVSASASIANIVLGLTCWALLSANFRLPEARFFLWFFMLANLLYGAGYWMASGVANFGDWANVIAGWKPHWAWRIGMTVFGSFFFMAFVNLSLHEFARIIGGQEPELYQRARWLAWVSYATAVGVVVLAGIFFSKGFKSMPVIAGLSAALGALSPLLWMMEWLHSDTFIKMAGDPLVISRNWIVIISAIIVTTLHAIFLNGRTARRLSRV